MDDFVYDVFGCAKESDPEDILTLLKNSCRRFNRILANAFLVLLNDNIPYLFPFFFFSLFLNNVIMLA